MCLTELHPALACVRVLRTSNGVTTRAVATAPEHADATVAAVEGVWLMSEATDVVSGGFRGTATDEDFPCIVSAVLAVKNYPTA